jgi:hypothetical protein
MWTSALAHCQKRFHGMREVYKREPSGGIGAFTPDSFPVFDTFRQNARAMLRRVPTQPRCWVLGGRRSRWADSCRAWALST